MGVVYSARSSRRSARTHKPLRGQGSFVEPALANAVGEANLLSIRALAGLASGIIGFGKRAKQLAAAQ